MGFFSRIRSALQSPPDEVRSQVNAARRAITNATDALIEAESKDA